MSEMDSQEEARLRLLDTVDASPCEGLDRITRTAARLFSAPLAVLSLSLRDEQWLVSSTDSSLTGQKVPNRNAPCVAITRTGQPLVIPNLSDHPQFSECMLRDMGVRFYAGAPVTTSDGLVLGSLSVLDMNERPAGSMEALADLASLAVAQIELRRGMGRVDPFSGLPNRGQLLEDISNVRATIAVELINTRQVGELVSVLGSAYLDDFVRTTSRLLRDLTESTDCRLYHIGAVTFAILMETGGTDAARDLVVQIAPALQEPVLCKGVEIPTSPAFGISPAGYPHRTGHDALRAAINSAQQARETAAPYVIYTKDGDVASNRRFRYLVDIQEALHRQDQLSLVYQPRIDLKHPDIASAEALLRWKHPEFGDIAPGEFIPLVEQTAMFPEVTRWVMRTAIRQMAEWRPQDLKARISINVSAIDLESPNFALCLSRYLEEQNVSPSDIELEFTESAVIGNFARVIGQLKDVRSLGVQLAIDDFGTGYSTFSYLQRLPADVMKIDRSFMRRLEDNLRDRKLVISMIGMAHDLGYRVVAEGVETRGAYDLLAEAGCDEIQGYIVSRPLTVDRFTQWMRDAQQKHREIARYKDLVGLPVLRSY
ncbi:sensor domain-containing phosphodiesterase [Bryobacterales bacterium F-183]|nr:sensor domain-containing phosphodiesterase [Bryobacterales bacterium F-183]